MATIDDFGGLNDPLNHPPLGGPNGWAAAVRDALNGRIRVTHPNADDLLVEASADGADWVTVHYDSGWRDISSEVTPGPGTTNVHPKLRRVNDTVFLVMWWNQDATAPTEMTMTPPTGFHGSQIDSHIIATHAVTDKVIGKAYTTGLNTLHLIPVASQSARWQGPAWSTSDPTPTSLPGTRGTAGQ